MKSVKKSSQKGADMAAYRYKNVSVQLNNNQHGMGQHSQLSMA